MREFSDLSETEKMLRTLIYAIESKDKSYSSDPVPLGEAYLKYKLTEAKALAEKLKIPLVNV